MLEKLAPILKVWDRIGASRPDVYIAISNRSERSYTNVLQETCRKVIYPPVDTLEFIHLKPSVKASNTGYFLTVSRLVSYKKLPYSFGRVMN